MEDLKEELDSVFLGYRFFTRDSFKSTEKQSDKHLLGIIFPNVR
jgi:hypothetical protein